MKTKVRTQIKAMVEEAAKMAYPVDGERARLNMRLASVIYTLDACFGNGYAEKHPELIGHCLQSMAIDQIACAGTIEDGFSAVSDSIETLAESLDNFGKTADEIASTFVKHGC